MKPSEKLALYRHGIAQLTNLRKDEDAPPTRSPAASERTGIAIPVAEEKRSQKRPQKIVKSSQIPQPSFPWLYKRRRKPNPRVYGEEWTA